MVPCHVVVVDVNAKVVQQWPRAPKLLFSDWMFKLWISLTLFVLQGEWPPEYKATVFEILMKNSSHGKRSNGSELSHHDQKKPPFIFYQHIDT